MGALGREAMIAFYLGIHHDMLNSHATPAEVHYVETACQQTLLRLIIIAIGSRSASIDFFFSKTRHQWPNLIPPADGDGKLSNWQQWVGDFLLPIPEIPESLKMEGASFAGQVELRRFMSRLQSTERSVAEAILIEPEDSPALLQDSLPVPPSDPAEETEQQDSFEKASTASAIGTSGLLFGSKPAAASEEIQGEDEDEDANFAQEEDEDEDQNDQFDESEEEEEIQDRANALQDADVIVLGDTSEEEQEEEKDATDSNEEEEESDHDVASTGDVHDDDSDGNVSLGPVAYDEDDDEDDDPAVSDDEDDDHDDYDGAAGMIALRPPDGEDDDQAISDDEDEDHDD